MANELSPDVALNPYALASFATYLVAVIGVGLYASRYSSRGLAEFFLGGRKLRSFVVALSAVASGRSAWLLVGVTGMAYVRGVSAVWSVVGYTVAELILFLTVAPRLRRATGEVGAITLPDFFATRFNDAPHLLRTVSALVILVFMVIYVAAQFDAGGKAFGASFGLSHREGVLATALIVWLYTLLGGFLAVALTDVIQACLMLTALLVVPLLAVLDFGGLQRLFSELQLQEALLLDPFALSVGTFIGFVGIGLGSTGNPHILVRYMSIDDPQRLKRAAVFATCWNVLMGLGATLIGLAGRVYFPDAGALPRGDAETLFPSLAQIHLPPLLFGMVIAAILAAIMSTADSQLLVAASSAVRDIYEKVVRRVQPLSASHLVRMSRWMVSVLVLLALGLREFASEIVFWLVLFAWGGLGAAFGPPLLFSLYWKRTTGWGVLAGLISGTAVVIVWNQSGILKQSVYELVPAFAISSLLVYLVSRLTGEDHHREGG